MGLGGEDFAFFSQEFVIHQKATENAFSFKHRTVRARPVFLDNSEAEFRLTVKAGTWEKQLGQESYREVLGLHLEFW